MAATSGRVLVVDDSEVIRQLIRVNLELEGFEVVTAADGAECLEVVRRVAPDVVTLDVVMPRLDGLRTAARLRAARETAHLPIAIVSACTPADLERGESVGVDGYLAKPFDPAELVALVRRLRAGSASSADPTAGPAGPIVPAPVGRRFAYDFGSPPPAPPQALRKTSRDSALSEQSQELVRPDDPRP
ncbi:response regulator [Kitasatospora sp. NPDC001540]|uniref:response regulator n=1 Tax=Kitasatospora sp. NPDC001540 TaxID=3364014 RepID=UPI0036A47E58